MKSHAETAAWKINPFTSQLGRRIVLILILVSGSITLVTTLTQLFYEYKQQFNSVELRHKEIQDVHTRLMARSLWDFDLVLLKQRMDSLVNLPDIDYLSIKSGDYLFEAGKKITGQKLTHSYPLTFDDPFTGEHNKLGELYVESDTSSIYRGLINKFFTTLMINSAKTLFVCYIILIIFHKSINQRILAIMGYLRSYSPQLIREPLSIKKTRLITSDNDELSILANETNKLTDNLSDLYHDITVEQERLSDFAHVSSDWLWETDANLHLIYCSEAMETALDIIDGQYPSFFELKYFYPDFQLISLLNKKQNFSKCEQCLTIDGDNFYLLFQAKARYKDNVFLGFRGTAINITNLKHAQLQLEQLNANLEATVHKRTEDLENSLNQLRQTQSQLIESEKLAALGGLVAGVAHEVNTPLGISVTAFSIVDEATKELNEAFKAQTLTSEQFAQLMEQLTSAGEMLQQNLNRAARLIRDFKQTAVDQVSENLDNFNIMNVLSSLMASLHPRTRKVPVTPTIEGDETLMMNSLPGVLTQIISNLVVNSVTHAFENQPNPEIGIRFTQQDDMIIFEYWDNGVGIAEELHQKVFEPFFTTKRGQGGSGLGLNIVFNLVHQKLKGSLKFSSELNKGVHFTISVPQQLSEEQV